jgi:hypothetical protein
MRPLRIIVAVLALLCSIAPSGAAADRIHKILIVHSYHQGLAWTDSISEGIRSALVPFDRRIELYFEYLDIKRRPRPLSEEDLPAYFQPDSGFDVVITADEEAFELVRRREIGSGPVLPVVFCGISRFEPATIDPAQAVTGVLETVAHRDNVKLMACCSTGMSPEPFLNMNLRILLCRNSAIHRSSLSSLGCGRTGCHHLTAQSTTLFHAVYSRRPERDLAG